MISALNTCLVIHQRKAKVLRESGLKSKQSQELYIRLLLHFAGTKFISRVDYFSFFFTKSIIVWGSCNCIRTFHCALVGPSRCFFSCCHSSGSLRGASNNDFLDGFGHHFLIKGEHDQAKAGKKYCSSEFGKHVTYTFVVAMLSQD